MRGSVFTLALIISVFLCFGGKAFANNSDMYTADYQAMKRALNSMLTSPKAQAKSWTGVNGDGDLRVSLAISSSQGLPCENLSNCENACRNYTYTFVGERKDGWIVNEERTGRICLSARNNWDIQGSESVKKTRKLNKSQRLIDAETQKKIDAERDNLRKAEEDRKRLEREAAIKEANEQKRLEREREDERQKNIVIAQQSERKVFVRSVQLKLNELQYNVGTADGAYGQQTLDGIMDFVSDARIEGINFNTVPSNAVLEMVDGELSKVIRKQKSLSGCSSELIDIGFMCVKVSS